LSDIPTERRYRGNIFREQDSGISKKESLQTVNELSIAQIVKVPLEVPANPTAGSCFAWSIKLNWPQGGEIAFGASGYTQTLRSEPRLLSEQRLPCDDRPALIYP
jgi:hypothetical protein